MRPQPLPSLIATPDGVLLNGIPLHKSIGRQQLSPRATRYIDRAEELLKQVAPENWDDCTPHNVNDVPALAKAQMMLALANPIFLDKYSPDQPRDWHGRWTNNGAGASSGVDDKGEYQVADSGIILSDVVASDTRQNSINTIRQGVQTKDHGLIKPVTSNPYTQQGSDYINQANIYIGGAMDHSGFHNVLNSESLSHAVGSNYYFTHSDREAVNDLIQNIPDDTEVNLIGHSWGGDTAARVTMDNPDRIHTLITADPVTTFHETPDFGQVRNSVKNWVDVNAVGHGGFLSDITNGNVVAGFGAWNDTPAEHADIYITSNIPHGGFDSMMDTKDTKTGLTPQSIIDKQYQVRQ